MEKLTQLLNKLVEKYKMEQSDRDAIDQAILELAGLDMAEGEEFNLPDMEDGNDGHYGYED